MRANMEGPNMKRKIAFKDATGTVFYLDITLEAGKFSMSGSYPGGGGQCQDHIKARTEAQRDLIKIWERWHLNDMKAGTQKQMDALKNPEFEIFKKSRPELSHYDAACAYLKTLRLYSVPDPRPEHKGERYKYGHAWLTEVLPEDLERWVNDICARIEAEEAAAGNNKLGGNAAEAFQMATGLKFSARFVKNDKYFPDDKEARNIYKITLRHRGRTYSFKFGQSIAESWTHKAPDLYSVLASITKEDPGTLEEFCSNYGYNLDSRKAEKVYKAVKEEFLNVCRLFNEEELSRLRDIN